MSTKRERRGRVFQFTIPVADVVEANKYKEQLESMRNTLVIATGQLEEGDTTGLHIQGVLKYLNARRLAYVEEVFDNKAAIKLIGEGDLLSVIEYSTKTHTALNWNFKIGDYDPANIRRSLGRKNAWQSVRSKKDQALMKNYEKIIQDGATECLTDIYNEDDINNTAVRMRQFNCAKEYAYRDMEAMSITLLKNKAKNVVWKPWQQRLFDYLNGPIEDRKIILVLDPVGNTGKTFFKKYYSAIYCKDTFTNEGGKTSDILYAAQQVHNRRVVIFDFVRTQYDHINLQAVEQLKNGCFCVTKYESKATFSQVPHCVIMSNHLIDFSGISFDRWEVWLLASDCDEFTIFKCTTIKKAFESIQYNKSMRENFYFSFKAVTAVFNTFI